MIPVILLTDGAEVVSNDYQIPPFVILPQVLIWGQRVFRRNETHDRVEPVKPLKNLADVDQADQVAETQKVVAYTEVFAFMVVDPVMRRDNTNED